MRIGAHRSSSFSKHLPLSSAMMMKVFHPAAILLLLCGTHELRVLAADDDVGCPDDSYVSRCSCSASNSTKDICNVTIPSFYEGTNGTKMCDAYCKTECGATAGAYFNCYRNDTTDVVEKCQNNPVCACSCKHLDGSEASPSPIRFPDQCSAFCDEEIICNRTQKIFTCDDDENSSGAAEYKKVVVIAASLMAMCVTTFFVV